jgi:hypothetical protein
VKTNCINVHNENDLLECKTDKDKLTMAARYFTVYYLGFNTTCIKLIFSNLRFEYLHVLKLLFFIFGNTILILGNLI